MIGECEAHRYACKECPLCRLFGLFCMFDQQVLRQIAKTTPGPLGPTIWRRGMFFRGILAVAIMYLRYVCPVNHGSENVDQHRMWVVTEDIPSDAPSSALLLRRSGLLQTHHQYCPTRALRVQPGLASDQQNGLVACAGKTVALLSVGNAPSHTSARWRFTSR